MCVIVGEGVCVCVCVCVCVYVCVYDGAMLQYETGSLYVQTDSTHLASLSSCNSLSPNNEPSTARRKKPTVTWAAAAVTAITEEFCSLCKKKRKKKHPLMIANINN